ncbi:MULTISPECIES: hypothetical protein [unclassified Oleiphilus]|jgi:hypothetical protein|uniref:hypothetical protein n=1 Tax=unclassified Oleiphilus TaxID=2631174 RepID=UPI0007C251BC|nr:MULTISPECIES: hypothetical protein [unclassified Oleiphilus]KZY41784.1 hypothetical protein A3732_17485 [Oleiphilus sp. HI0050]KZY75883.1 hypothetical protein A3740_02230 [Oleiphilus sp. HI0068]KZY77341.1 hypothetical protein A3741_09875 [Oleiphilus sp. HI0069]KZY87789.1 hypothetical protein A3743_01840 [Oleiphilus sp. HI0072]KZZ20062.1 hypothetical protein A3749_00375 [Oleiphilus sp. HI0078]KZZ37320.1 hypothetical protein A3755_05515 [Oleiphilus sp. HI0085]
MELSNSLIAAPVIPEGLKKPSQERPNPQDNADSRSNEARVDVPRRIAAPEDLERKSNELQQSRVQRLDALDSAPLKAQQALSTYQQTEEAGRAYEEGELVGLDLFV